MLRSSVNSLASFASSLCIALKHEREKSRNIALELEAVKSSVHILKKHVDDGHRWQGIVYDEIQKFHDISKQHSDQLAQLSYYYQNGQQYEQQYEANSYGYDQEGHDQKHHIRKRRGNKKKSSKSTLDGQPVPYGDSCFSKPHSERKRLGKKSDGSNEANTLGEDSALNQIKAITISDDQESEEELPAKEDMETEQPVSCWPPSNEEILQNCPTTEEASEESTEASTSITGQPGPTKSENTSVEPQGIVEKSIAESLAEAASSVVAESGFTYDEASGMYYDWNSEMYYDPSSKTYYNHKNGCYYYYDSEKGEFVFHSQIEVPDEDSCKSKNDIEKDDSDLSEGEISSDSEPESIDPCIRLIVVKSETLSLGSLYIITCSGGTMGRGKDNNVCIEEIMISKMHVKFIYDSKDQTFYIQDMATPNGTWLNNERLTDSKVEMDPMEICHRDFLKVGDTVFSVHVHRATDTCLDCEPGNVQALINAKQKEEEEALDMKSLDEKRRDEMKLLRKQYGINKGYLPKALLESIPDRAMMRRKKVGIDTYEDKSLPIKSASVTKEIPTDNLGHKMLAKMGWKSGEGLGKTSSGITEPVNVGVRDKNAGLGSGTPMNIDNDRGLGKSNKWNKAKLRYDKLK